EAGATCPAPECVSGTKQRNRGIVETSALNCDMYLGSEVLARWLGRSKSPLGISGGAPQRSEPVARPPFPETPDECGETEEQDPGRENQLDPWCDAGGEEQDESDRVAGER